MGFLYLFSIQPDHFNFNFIKQKKPELLSLDYINNFTAGLTFFIAVAATNLFHQGNWQRVYAAQNNKTLTYSLILSLFNCYSDSFYNGVYWFSGYFAK